MTLGGERAGHPKTSHDEKHGISISLEQGGGLGVELMLSHAHRRKPPQSPPPARGGGEHTHMGREGLQLRPQDPPSILYPSLHPLINW